MVEQIELTMSHVGLGFLNEYALMVLFGNAHSHALVEGTGILPNQIEDGDGNILYPAYFMTNLKVPEENPLMSYQLWDNVMIGVDVSRYGDSMLQSDYIIKEENLEKNQEQWKRDCFPSMHANSLFIVDGDNTAMTRRVSVPKPECIAPLSRVKKMPSSILRSKNIRVAGFGNEQENKMEEKRTYEYYVNPDQDAAPGHAMLFAKFVKISDWAEQQYLSEQQYPFFPLEVLKYLSVQERETYYYGNCHAGELLLVSVRCKLLSCPQKIIGTNIHMLSAGILQTETMIYRQRDHLLLAAMNAKKQILAPMELQDLLLDVKRVITLWENK